MINEAVILETLKFILRELILVGIPATLAAIAEVKPEWGVIIGIILAILDKAIHVSPVKSKGILPF